MYSWTVIVRRFDGSGDYNRSWAEYKSGFGDVSGEAWLGNEYLHYLTNNRFVKIIVPNDCFMSTHTHTHTHTSIFIFRQLFDIKIKFRTLISF